MKYFLFVFNTRRQFEYVHLSFDYSEPSAEFQKRVVQILQPFIRDNKILVYIYTIDILFYNSIDSNL